MRHSWTIAVLDRDTPRAQIIFVRAKAHGLSIVGSAE
jgi:hypothetical protein